MFVFLLQMYSIFSTLQNISQSFFYFYLFFCLENAQHFIFMRTFATNNKLNTILYG